jgi:hypothetical protein
VDARLVQQLGKDQDRAERTPQGEVRGERHQPQREPGQRRHPAQRQPDAHQQQRRQEVGTRLVSRMLARIRPQGEQQQAAGQRDHGKLQVTRGRVPRCDQP